MTLTMDRAHDVAMGDADLHLSTGPGGGPSPPTTS